MHPAQDHMLGNWFDQLTWQVAQKSFNNNNNNSNNNKCGMFMGAMS